MDAPFTIQLEPWSRYHPECVDLWKEHYAEFEGVHLGRMAMCPDVGTYRLWEATGQLDVLVARGPDGAMVGYFLMITRPHIHYAGALCSFEDSYFVTKTFRQTGLADALFEAAIARMRQRGAVRGYIMTKLFNSIGRKLERMGGEKCDEVYAFWLQSSGEI